MPARRHRRALCWIRRDLRTTDHAALTAATEAAERTAVAFVFDTNILGALEDRDDRRVSFIYRSLQEVDAKLRHHGSQLLLRHGDPIHLIPELARELEADLVVTARDYEPYAIKRDAEVAEALAAQGCEFQTVQDTVILEPDQVLGANGPFRVYSPFMRAWRKILAPNVHAAEQAPDLRRLDADLAPHGRRVTLADMGFEPSDLWLEPGEDAARRQAREFMTRIGRYKDERDFPARPGVSALSVHLRFGTVSIRELVRLALEHEGEGSEKWVNELIWREFYQSILYHFPQVVERTFQEQYEELEYPGTKEDFDRWCDGQTGYPIVDAAMRCLRETGYMHNRLRMVAASFLTKDLLVDYRWGEAHFARLLLDFELASNNGGWQWAAGTGADPQPYFRIFNPMLQSKKFDPDGAFIRRWVPELSELEGAALHEPWLAPAMELAAAGVELGKSYPAPIVDHYQQRERAIRLLESVRR